MVSWEIAWNILYLICSKVDIILTGHISQFSIFLATEVTNISTFYIYKVNKGIQFQKFSDVNKPWPTQDSLEVIAFNTVLMCFK